MIKTLSDYNLLESEEWKDSINTLFLELRSKLPEFFKEVPLPTIPHEDYVEVVIPASKQVMMEEFGSVVGEKLGLHILLMPASRTWRSYRRQLIPHRWMARMLYHSHGE